MSPFSMNSFVKLVEQVKSIILILLKQKS